MLYYRLYFLDEDQHVSDAVPFECSGDEAAIEFAQRRAEGRPMELWNQDRLVMRRWHEVVS